MFEQYVHDVTHCKSKKLHSTMLIGKDSEEGFLTYKACHKNSKKNT